MTELSTELQALVNNGKERYEDSIVSDAIKTYIGHVGAVPDFAWGKMPWSAKWKTDWHTAVEARTTEAGTIRDALGTTGSNLIQVASDYSHSDIEATLDFDISTENSALTPFLKGTRKAGDTVSGHPGGHAGPPPYFPGGGYTVDIPNSGDDNKKLNYLWKDGRLNNVPAEMGPPGFEHSYNSTIQGLETPGHGDLTKFVNEHYQTLTQAENIVEQYGGGLAQLPSRDFIDDVREAYPGVIKNRADLMNVVKNNYEEMRREMALETDTLKLYWASPSASQAYFIHANNLLKYLDSVAVEAGWLATEGKKAGDTIDKLMLAYAKVGYEKIGTLIDQIKAVTDAANSMTGSVSDPVKAVQATLNYMVTTMLADWKAANEAAKSMLNVTDTAISGQPELGSIEHNAKPFPQDGAGGQWTNGSQWQPGQRNVPVPTS
jgi:hypothetical protein